MIVAASVEKIRGIFKKDSGAGAFFLSIFVWGIAVGCFSAAMNNFLADVYRMDSVERGWLEFFRELPGLLLVFVLALLYKVSDWRVMRLGTLVSMAGVALLLVPADKIFVTAFIMIWSMGEHLVMPVRSSIAMQVAEEKHAGQSLGFLTGMMNFGSVAGSLIVAALFFAGVKLLHQPEKTLFYALQNTVIICHAASPGRVRRYSPNSPVPAASTVCILPPGIIRRKSVLSGSRRSIFVSFKG